MPADEPRQRRWTVLEVQRYGPDNWRVTQEGSEVVGQGPTAARAAADYCTAVADESLASEGEVGAGRPVESD